MTRLTDTQLILLSTAHAREIGSLLPLPKTLLDPATAQIAIGQLIRGGYAEERIVTAKGLTWRTDAEGAFGVFMTDKGRDELTSAVDGRPIAGDARPKTAESATRPFGRKRESVVALLKRDGGATIDDLSVATGWLPHSARAGLSGLRKSGYAIERVKADGGTRYFIAGARR